MLPSTQTTESEKTTRPKPTEVSVDCALPFTSIAHGAASTQSSVGVENAVKVSNNEGNMDKRSSQTNSHDLPTSISNKDIGDDAILPPTFPTTHRERVYLDITIDDALLDRVVIELFYDLCPITCENFRRLCAGSHHSSKTNRILTYRGSSIFRCVPSFIIQGGDITNNDGTGGESALVPSKYFRSENFKIRHSVAGIVSMANKGIPDTNNSQFFFTCCPAPWLDRINVAFGQVVKGHHSLAKIESYGSPSGRISGSIKVFDCGVFETEEGSSKDRESVIEEQHEEPASESPQHELAAERGAQDAHEGHAV